MPEGSRFFRKGAPDAGVECFWRLPNADEWAWQAKFFLTSPGQSQWHQVHASVKAALHKHPHLTKYTVCMPVDLPDDRSGGRKSAHEKWADSVAGWEKLASTNGMSVSFEFWGQSEIGGRLSNEKHRGRHWFWFNEEQLSNSWFASRVNEAVENARDRYSPELNVDLPIRSSFDALGRTAEFFSRLTELYTKARIAFNRLRPTSEPEPLKQAYDRIVTMAPQLFALIEPWVLLEASYLEWTTTRPIPWNEITLRSQELSELVDGCLSAVRDLKGSRGTSDKPQIRNSTDDLDSRYYYLREFEHTLYEITGFSSSKECLLSNCPAMLLVGAAGQGKTHLLCDVAKRETEDSRPRLIFHGEHFHDDEPWSQMIRLVGLNCSRDELIGAIEAAAQANNCRVLLLIDALNEGDGNRLWWKFLPGILTTLARSQWLGICVSIRNTYEPHIIPPTLDETRIVRVEHYGFGEFAYRAAAKFFAHFGLEPSAPVLFPEFDNPLFLKLFCQSIHNAGLTRVPSGLRGVTKIFRFFVESIDKKLARADSLNYDDRDCLVAKAVDNLSDEMAIRKSDRLPLDKAKAIVNALLPRDEHQRSLFHSLESEGVLTVVPESRSDSDEWSESVRFTYQRFSDHLITQRLLKRYLDKREPKKSFSRRRALGQLVKDERTCWMNSGILESLAIQIPEITKKELPNLAPHLAGYLPMREAFVASIVWRDAESFSVASDRYINKHVLAFRGTFASFWDAMISLATAPNHPMNADRLHQILIRGELATRDAWWSIFLHDQYGSQRSVDRLVEWALDESDKSTFDDEVVRLSAIALAWFFTTANRFLRDRATKAMVRLCEERIQVLRHVLKTFKSVDDPYVSERLHAVAYGCAMRTNDVAALAGLAQDVYRAVFESGMPPPHALLRDYARGVIEVAIHRGAIAELDVAKTMPPYRSEWPLIDIPEPIELETWGQSRVDMPDREWARVHLYHSVMDDDFSRYVIGGLDEWSSCRSDEPKTPTHKELYEEFVDSLTNRQRRAFDAYATLRSNIDLYRRLGPDAAAERFGHRFTDGELNAALTTSRQAVLRSLGTNFQKRDLFNGSVEAFMAEPHTYSEENRFDGQLARRWLIKRIIDMGWTVERFGDFDRNVNRYSRHGREPNKPERIGKKYQWIAYYELLARLSDNFRMRDDEWSPRGAQGQEPCTHSFRRDIDPSNLVRSTQCEEWRAHTNSWWFPARFESWDVPPDEVRWLKNHDVPRVEDAIVVTHPGNGARWCTLHGYYRWAQRTPTGEEQFEAKRREVWCMLKSYFIRRSESQKLLRWALKQSWMGRWMPESHEAYGVLLGEFFWSPAFREMDCSYYGRNGWSRQARMNGRELPAEILIANDGYAWESGGFDCSVDGTIFIELPCRFLADGMQLSWRGVEGEWVNQKNELCAVDPSVRSKGPRVLLVRHDALSDFLTSNGLTLFWTLLGEKRTIGGSMSGADYNGYLEINGAYVLKDGAVSGQKHVRYVPPRAR
ncbi:MAG TPA: AVAST type 2 anti-phage system protein Avs2 [Pirellulales bacterium]|nr:AVAST type 2 anti-phage system protein Avs2 [Pirellulales bacterium]